jgi:hypothetical protein
VIIGRPGLPAARAAGAPQSRLVACRCGRLRVVGRQHVVRADIVARDRGEGCDRRIARQRHGIDDQQ